MIPVTVILLALRKVEAGVNNFCGTKFLSETWVLGAPTTIFFLITSFIGERGKPPNNPTPASTRMAFGFHIKGTNWKWKK